MRRLALAVSFVALALAGAIAGFFYAYSVSVMWGLDGADPASAIRAMQGINGAVRNAAFAPAFFGTPVAAALAAFLWLGSGRPAPALFFSAALVVYALGALMPTLLVHVAMNDALAKVVVPADPQAARILWQDFSGRWLGWNHVRTGASLVALLLMGAGLNAAGRPRIPA